MAIKGIIFDLDGVLVHTDLYHFQAWKALADTLGIYFDEQINNRLRGVSRMDSLEIILERYQGKPFSAAQKLAFADKKNAIYRNLLQQMTPQAADSRVRDTLTALKSKGYLLAVGSSSKNADMILQRTDLQRYFDVVIDGNCITYSKPNPEVFLKAAAQLHLPAAACAVVEDAAAGIDAACAAGMHSIGIGDAAHYEKAAYKIQEISDLCAYFQQEASAVDLKAAPFFLNETQCEWVQSTLAGMTDTEKLGQLFCVMGGDFAPDALQTMAAQGKIGAVLFRPVETGAAIAKKLESLDANAKIPLLKAANLEEGGAGCRSDGTLFGFPMLAAATDDEATAQTFGSVCGAEGADIGINWSFSPVCDLDLNYQNPITNVRTYGSDVSRVMRMTQSYLKGLEAQGVTACAKHFPGDGVDYRDQHLHPSVNSLSAAEWYASYGKIYKALIENGLLSMMVGHIAQPQVALDSAPDLTLTQQYLPATLSPTLLQKVLRGTLGFQGLVTSDATIMAGFTTPMERKKAIPAAIMAGCDMLVFNTDFIEDTGYLEDALASGALTHARLNEAVTRILALKAKICGKKQAGSCVDSKAAHRAAANRAITLVKSIQADALPVTPQKYPHILLITLGKDEIKDGSVENIAKTYLEQQGFEVKCYDWQKDELHGTSKLATNRLTLYFANFEQYSNQTAIRIPWSPKHALNVPRFPQEETSIFVSLANPYHLQDVPRVKTYINAYTATKDVIELTIDKLMGKSAFTGVSPVDAFCGLPDAKL